MTAQPIDAPRGFVSKAEYYKALARIEELEAEVADLRKRTGDSFDINRLAALKRRLPKLRPAECRVVVALYEAAPRTIHRKTMAEIAVMFDSDEPENVLRTTICRANKMMVAAGCAYRPIESVWGIGYYLTQDAHQWLTENVYGGKS